MIHTLPHDLGEGIFGLVMDIFGLVMNIFYLVVDILALVVDILALVMHIYGLVVVHIYDISVLKRFFGAQF